MSRVRAACDRLEQAVSRLAEAVRSRDRLAARDRSEVARLEQELEATRESYRSLREVTDGVSARLDATIGRIKGVLGE